MNFIFINYPMLILLSVISYLAYGSESTSLVLYTQPKESRAIVPYIPPFIHHGIDLIKTKSDPENRYLEFFFNNSRLLPIYDCLEIIYHMLLNNKDYLNFAEMKIILTMVEVNAIDPITETEVEHTYSLHKNVAVNNKTTFKQFISYITDTMKHNYLSGYDFDAAKLFIVKIWKADHYKNAKIVINNKGRIDLENSFTSEMIRLAQLVCPKWEPTKPKKSRGRPRKNVNLMKRSYSTSAVNMDRYNVISKLKKPCVSPKPFTTMDIETVNVNGLQTPFLITCKVTSQVKSFITFDLSEKGVTKLWFNYFSYLFSKLDDKLNIIFVHNLGRFDGVFIQKHISKAFDLSSIESTIDESNRFITIKVVNNGRTFIFIDSLRIFPVSLNNLCKVFNIPGKLVDYNPDWNDRSILSNKNELSKIIEYAKQDSLALFNALKEGQQFYINKYKVDITSIVSLPSLAMKIFRLCFQYLDIPVLSGRNRYLY
uniref:DNA polymerase n=1 Tax=Dichomitus squalens TaxID=114155 RepID=UPI00300124AD|nr:DNA polymerase [Dichomitus squalens]